MHRQWNQEEYRDTAWMYRHGIREARAQLDLSLARTVKNTTSFYRYIGQKGPLQENVHRHTQIWWIRQENQWLTTWRWLRYSIFLSVFSLVITLPITLKSQTSKEGLGEQSPFYHGKRSGSRPTKEPEHTQVHGTWWGAPEEVGRCSC